MNIRDDSWRERITRLSKDAPFVIAVWRAEPHETGLRLIDASDDLAARYGLPAEVFDDDRVWRNAIHPDDMPLVRAQLRKAKETGRFKATFRLRTADGAQRWIEVAYHIHRDADGSRDAIGYITDATEQREREERLQQSARLVLLGEMATGMAHELNQPLNVIRLAGENALHRLPEGCDEQTSYMRDKLRRIVAQTVRASRIVERMRIFGRRTEHDSGPIKPKALVTDAIAMVEPQCRQQGIRITTRVDENLPAVHGDRAQLRQALANVLLNSLDAVAERLGDGPAKEGPNPFVLVRAWHDAAAGRVRFTVEDRGGGFAPETLDRVLDPFFTTKEPGRGVGLGLSITYGILRDHDGELAVANSDDGAVVTLSLKPVA